MSRFLNQFAISFAHLKEGIHQYDYEIKDEFFENFEFSEAKKGNLCLKVILEKTSRILSLNFIIKGSVITECDICLDEVEIEIESDKIIFVKFGDNYREETDEIIFIPFNCNEINIAQYIYEYIHLALPMKRVHPDDNNGKSTCNPIMLKRINELQCKKEQSNRWDILKNLNNIKEN